MKNVVNFELPNHLDFKDLLSLNEAGILKDEVLEKRKNKKLDEIKSLFPKEVIQMIGEDNLLMGDNIEWDDKWLGGTDYIDRIKPKDLNNTFSYGIDCYKRPFIFVKMKSYKNNSIFNFVVSIFQRYTSDGLFVAIDPMNGCSEYMAGSVSLTESYRERLTELFLEKYEMYKLCK